MSVAATRWISRALPAALTLSALLLPNLAEAASPTTSDLLTNFNVITDGSFSTSSDVEGAMLVGGNLSGGGNLDIRSLSPGGTTSGYGAINIYGNASGSSNTESGLAVKIGGTNSNPFNNAGSITTGVTFPTPIGTIWSQITQLSAGLANITTSTATYSAVQNSPSISVTGSVPGYSGVAVLNITGANLGTLTNQGGQLAVNLNGATLLVINVTGAFTQGNTNLYNSLSNIESNVLWNFTSSTSPSFQTEVAGTVLAPLAAFNDNGYDVDGNLIANSVTNSAELHSHPLSTSGNNGGFLNSFSTPVPEPASLLLLGNGLAGLRVIRRRRR